MLKTLFSHGQGKAQLKGTDSGGYCRRRNQRPTDYVGRSGESIGQTQVFEENND